jgi:NAD-dependent DNA ligase
MDKKEILSILDKLDAADEAYYNSGIVIITDTIYDGLKDKLKNIVYNPQTPAEQKIAARIEDCLTRIGAPPYQWGHYQSVILQMNLVHG